MLTYHVARSVKRPPLGCSFYGTYWSSTEWSPITAALTALTAAAGCAEHIVGTGCGWECCCHMKPMMRPDCQAAQCPVIAATVNVYPAATRHNLFVATYFLEMQPLHVLFGEYTWAKCPELLVGRCRVGEHRSLRYKLPTALMY
jgi:hypothetical protein